MFFLGLILPTAYWPGLDGWTINSAWPVLSIILPFYFLRPIRVTVHHLIGFTFLIYAFISLSWTSVWQQGIWDLWLLTILSCGFMIGASGRNLRSFYLGLGLGVGVSTIVSVFQFLGYEPVAVVSNAHPAGLFFNFDVFGEVAALASVALIVNKFYLPLLLTIPPITFTHSRTALLMLFTVCAVWLWETYRWRSAWIIAPCLAAISFGLWLHGYDQGISLRLSMWRDTISGLTITGRGPGSFFMDFPLFAAHSDTMSLRPEVPHNDILLLVFQYGFGTIPLFLLGFIALGSTGPERYILACLVPTILLGFPSIVPAEGFVAAVAIGRLCVRRDIPWLDGYFSRLVDALRPLRLRRGLVSLEQIYSSSTRLRGADV